MQYPEIPVSLPPQALVIFEWIRARHDETLGFMQELSTPAARNALTQEAAVTFLDRFIWFAASCDLACQTLEDMEGDLEVHEALEVVLDAYSKQADEFTGAIFLRLCSHGANANLLLKEAEDRYYR
jgi:hypothetical protein